MRHDSRGKPPEWFLSCNDKKIQRAMGVVMLTPLDRELFILRDCWAKRWKTKATKGMPCYRYTIRQCIRRIRELMACGYGTSGAAMGAGPMMSLAKSLPRNNEVTA